MLAGAHSARWPRKIMAMPAIVILVLSASQHPIVTSTLLAARNRVVWSAG